ncbi:acyl-ACP thioesterase [Lactobacillus sp. CC-MHH1034]|uniref:acyl-[acyl-carrier-protein] thioesterase n=1 Tax=Agrilactobacillus fermenti TaxID=2586909 RepID=UPI001E5FBA8C|nr:acyl-ACP thioesterase domain-containing protein [Agrilactobacillus fermenti]MCD2255451.1 acyl-ACP thioesterase [Agrilactobacillus fermenti]
MARQILSRIQRVPFYEVNTFQEWHVSTMLNAMLAVADDQLDQLNAGDEVMHAKALGWVITQYHFDIQRFPKSKETVTLSSWADSYNQFFSYRDYQMTDAMGQELVHINSSWVMMSFKTRKMVRVDPEIVKNVIADPIRSVKKFPRIPKKDYTGAQQKPYRVRYFDIDANQHVNNVHYFDWMIDTLDLAFIKKYVIDTIDIRYEREVKYGETPVSSVIVEPDESDKSVTTYHQIKTADRVNTECEIHWHLR